MKYRTLMLWSLAIGSSALPAWAQNPDSKRLNHWYFGFGAGLDFSSGAPVADTTGQIDYDRGSAVMSDSDGNLLFYTDGRQVWNAQHDSMPNGDINGYMFFGQATQTPIAVPKPGSEHLYYIFTSDGFSSTPANVKGLQYHIVDMSLNGGLGAVVQKNVQLATLTAEQVCVTRHANTCDYWLIGHERESADYLAWRISSEGVDSVPVISTTGSDYSLIHQLPANANWTGGLNMTCSPQGDKLAAIAYWRWQNSGHSDEIWLSHFNNANGVISGAFLVPLDTTWTCYAFSPNGQVFYAEYGYHTAKFDQFDLSVFDSAAVNFSRLNLHTGDHHDIAVDLKIGPDGKLYGGTPWGIILGKDSMAVIHQPNVLGPDCQLERWGIGLNGRYAGFRLQDQVSSFGGPEAPEHACSAHVGFVDEYSRPSCALVTTGLVVDGLRGDASYEYRVMNTLGQVLATGRTTGTIPCLIALPSIPSGHYVVHLSLASSGEHALRFVRP